MKTKCIAILIAFCLLIPHASAQPYSIRANRGLNLRTEPSLNASIAETILSGTVLQVVGKLNRWLKIDRNGREVWLADWVNFSRVESGEPSASQQPTAQIDNCCFVNRQCATNQEWTDGYWAFQRNECPSGQPAAPVSAPVSASEDVDNCCFVDRLCSSDQEWLDGYWAYQAGQCGAPSQSQTQPSRPLIEGSARFAVRIKAALDLMQRSAPEWYDYVSRYVDLIREVPDAYPDCWSSKAFVYHESARNVYVETCMAFPWYLGSEGRAIHMSGVLAHEACHKRHEYEGIVYPGGRWEEELECMKPGAAVTRALDPGERDGRSFLDVDFVIARLRATNCFANINSYEDYSRVLDNFWDGGGADYTC